MLTIDVIPNLSVGSVFCLLAIYLGYEYAVGKTVSYTHLTLPTKA